MNSLLKLSIITAIIVTSGYWIPENNTELKSVSTKSMTATIRRF